LPTNRGVGMYHDVSSDTEVQQIALDLFPAREQRSFFGPVVQLREEGTGYPIGVGLVVHQVGGEDGPPHSDSTHNDMALIHPTLFSGFSESGDFEPDGEWWCLDRADSGQVRLRRWSAEEGAVLTGGSELLADPITPASVSVQDLLIFWRKLSRGNRCSCGGRLHDGDGHFLSIRSSVMYQTAQGGLQLMSGVCHDDMVHHDELHLGDVVIDGRAIPPDGRLKIFSKPPGETLGADQVPRQVG